LKKLLYLLCMLGIISAPALALDAATMQVKVYEFAVSESEYCTDAVVVFEPETPAYSDMVGEPELGEGTLDDGTYECVIIEMSDRIKFTPSADDGYCDTETEVTIDVCGSHGEQDAQLADGTAVECSSDEDRVAIFLSTTTNEPTNNVSAFTPPTADDDTLGINLGAALTVAGDTSGTFIIDTTDTVENDNDGESCQMQPPTFTFSTD